MTKQHLIVVGCGLVAAMLAVALYWVTISHRAIAKKMARKGLDPDMTSAQLEAAPIETQAAFYEVLESGRPAVFALPLLGLGSWGCFMYAVPHFGIYSDAACLAFVAWILNEVRLGRRSFRRR